MASSSGVVGSARPPKLGGLDLAAQRRLEQGHDLDLALALGLERFARAETGEDGFHLGHQAGDELVAGQGRTSLGWGGCGTSLAPVPTVSTILPKAPRWARYSCAAGASASVKVRSTIGRRAPESK